MSKLFPIVILIALVTSMILITSCDFLSNEPPIEEISDAAYWWCKNRARLSGPQCLCNKVLDIGDSYRIRDPIGGVEEITLWPVKVAFYNYPHWSHPEKGFSQDTCPDDPDCKWLETVNLLVYQDSFGEWKARR